MVDLSIAMQTFTRGYHPINYPMAIYGNIWQYMAIYDDITYDMYIYIYIYDHHGNIWQ